MSTEAFEWFVSTMVKNPTPALQEFVKAERVHLYALRSEDERRRFVDMFIEEVYRHPDFHHPK